MKTPNAPAEEPAKTSEASAWRHFPIDPFTTVIPLFVILLFCFLFLAAPDGSASILKTIRSFLENRLGVYYLAVGLGMLALALGTAFSRLGDIVLGKPGE